MPKVYAWAALGRLLAGPVSLILEESYPSVSQGMWVGSQVHWEPIPGPSAFSGLSGFPELTQEGLGEVPTEGNCSANIL